MIEVNSVDCYSNIGLHGAGESDEIRKVGRCRQLVGCVTAGYIYNSGHSFHHCAISDGDVVRWQVVIAGIERKLHAFAVGDVAPTVQYVAQRAALSAALIRPHA